MPVQAIKEFVGQPKDGEENYHGNRLVYFGWDKHLLFYAPTCVSIPPTMIFNDVIDQLFPQFWSRDPVFSYVNWREASWLRDGESFAPNFEASLQDNGITHKTIIRVQTPQ